MPVVTWVPVTWRDPTAGCVYDVWAVSRRTGASMRVTNVQWEMPSRKWVVFGNLQPLSEKHPDYRVTHYMRPPAGPTLKSNEQSDG